MPYPSISIYRKAKLEKPMGLGEGRITEGTIEDNWTTEKEIRAGSLGLRAITRVILTPGTPLDVTVYSRVPSPGSIDNIVKIRSYLRQVGNIRAGTPRYEVFSVAFEGSPDIALAPGSPLRAYIGSPVGQTPPRLRSQRPGSFSHLGSPTFPDTHYIAVGPGSYPLNFIAIGD